MSQASQPTYEITCDRAVMMPMRDGTRLAADIYRPKADGPFPAVIERTPYNREESVILRTRTPQYLAERGFVVVVQDVRGRFGSEGAWYPFVDDGWGRNRDGYDTVAWVAAQPWCNGKVATAGGSYAGQTQMFLAPTRPPSLACCFVREAASEHLSLLTDHDFGIDPANREETRGVAMRRGDALGPRLELGARPLESVIAVAHTSGWQ